MQKLCEIYSIGRRVTCWVGARNIVFFGLLGTTIAVDLFWTERPKSYYGFHVFKRVKPTQTIYEYPY